MTITWGTGSQRPKPTGAGTGPWYTDPYLWMNLAGTAADTWASTSSAHQANRTNIQLQREQREWQERMAGSEIQRRVRDLTLAGGNPALAFTEGSGASTPSVPAPHVESEYKGGLGAVGSAALMAAQLRNLNAQTANTQEATRGRTMTNNILNQFGVPMAGIKHDTAMIGKQAAAQKFDQSAESFPEKMKLLKQQVQNAGLAGEQTAAQLQQFREMTDKLITLATQQVEAGEIDLNALRNVAAIGGVEANRIKPIIDLVLEFFGNRRSIQRGF